jgi:ABC-type transporter Mla subunit MlaD
MSPTLKELYDEKRLLEALDQQKLQQMVQTIGTLEGMIAPIRNKVPQLNQAINQAKELAAQKLSGEGGLWKKLAQNVNDKYKIVDDLKDFITFEASMLQGLRAMPTVISLLKKMNLDPKAQGGAADQPLSQGRGPPITCMCR